MSDPHPPLDATLAVLRTRIRATPDIALILGSGLGSLADALEEPVAVPTTELPHYPTSTAPGHKGRLVFGMLEGRRVACVQGRVHLYEGVTVQQIVFPVRLLHALGVRRLLVTNAAGGINPTFREGDLMFIADHINFAAENPLIGPPRTDGPRFPDMSAPYDPAWLERALEAARREGIPVQTGVYLWTKGPSYETRAEIRMYRTMGADAVGMSTVPEVIQARYLGLDVLGVSAITNLATGLSPVPLRHEDVLEAGWRLRERAERLVRALLRDTVD
jgi:purine-nucleoside phosphorylase